MHKIPVLIFCYIRALFQLLWLVFHTVIGGSILIAETFLIKNRKFEDATLKFWGRMQLWLTNVHVEVESDQVPNEGCLFLFNHASYSDIFVLYGYLPKPFRFGAKIELFSIPIFGATMKSVGVLPIVRDQREDVLKVYKEAIARVRNGECFGLAPEGTRQDGKNLGKFKLGPFVFARNANMPIVPVVMTNTWRVQPKGSPLMNANHFKTVIKLKTLKPIYPEGRSEFELRAMAFEVMDKEYHRLLESSNPSME